MKKYFITFFSILGVIILITLITHRQTIFQEGNPLPLWGGIVKLSLGTDKLVYLGEDKYLTGAQGKEIIIKLLADNNYELVDQLGAGYLFSAEDKGELIVTAKHYSRYFYLWSISKSVSLEGREFKAAGDIVILETDPGADWLTGEALSGQAFKYPETLSTKYLSPVVWPPELKVVNGEFSCLEGGTELAEEGETSLVIYQDQEFCLTKASEGAAGSTYTTYLYQVPVADWLAVVQVSLALRAPQCMNYDEPQASECEAELANFDPNLLALELVKTLSY